MANSVSAGIWNDLFYLYMGIALVVGALVVGWLVYNMIAFRARPGQPRPPDAPRPGVIPVERGHPVWGYVMALAIAGIMFGLAFGTISALDAMEKPVIQEGDQPLYMNVTGFQFGWKVDYVGAGGIPFQRINEWTVPADQPVIMNVTSQDVWHNFALPDYRVRIDAIPGEVTHIWFRALEPDVVNPVCVVICGTGHALMKSTMHVVPQEEYDQWLAAESAKEYARLERTFADGTRGSFVNVTFDGDSLQAAKEEVAAGRPVVVNLVHDGASPQEFSVSGADGDDRRVTVQPGERAQFYLVPAGGTLTVRAGDATAEIRVVS